MGKPRQAIPGLTPPPWTAHGTWVSAGENGDGPLVADFEYDADAGLGAAAPELLNALEQFAWEGPNTSCGYCFRDTRGEKAVTHAPDCKITVARAAIAKARGLDNPANSP